MKIYELLKKLNIDYPEDIALGFDNTGFNIGDDEEEIKNVLICLDVDMGAIKEAKDNNCNLIISHHPLTFNSYKNITIDINSKRIKEVIKNNINLYRMHTNFDMNLKYGIKSNYILSDLVIDQVCERDFYFGIAGSGIVIRTNVGFCKAPYFKPYGNPIDRASVPLEYENYFSRGCLERSIYLWNNIDKFKKRNTVIGELPERIINTQRSEEVVKSLKKELKNL